jgi:hypothetical protein
MAGQFHHSVMVRELSAPSFLSNQYQQGCQDHTFDTAAPMPTPTRTPVLVFERLDGGLVLEACSAPGEGLAAVLVPALSELLVAMLCEEAAAARL